jgi:hypothetical protein
VIVATIVSITVFPFFSLIAINYLANTALKKEKENYKPQTEDRMFKKSFITA